MVTILKKDKNETISYFLRCLWHLLHDPAAKDIIHWHPLRKDSFIIPDSQRLETFLDNYEPFKTSFNTLRRSLYFYAFKQRKNIWSHENLDKSDRQSLLNIKRKKSTNLNERMRRKYEQLLRQGRDRFSLSSLRQGPMVRPTTNQLPPPREAPSPVFSHQTFQPFSMMNPSFKPRQMVVNMDGRNFVVPNTYTMPPRVEKDTTHVVVNVDGRNVRVPRDHPLAASMKLQQQQSPMSHAMKQSPMSHAMKQSPMSHAMTPNVQHAMAPNVSLPEPKMTPFLLHDFES